MATPRPWPIAPVLAASAAALALAFLAVVLLSLVRHDEPAATAVPGFDVEPVAFADLGGWEEDDQAAALVAFRRSCARMERYGGDVAMGRQAVVGKIGDWRPACAAAADAAGDARAFFEAFFTPYAVTGAEGPTGLFTGYYEPLIEGRVLPVPPFTDPLRRPPADLIEADLGLWSDALKGKGVKGRVEDGRLVPYFDRAEIEAGALKGQGLDIFYVRPVDKFFLQIQGSGVVAFGSGKRVRVGYAGQNGRDYRPIGRDLIEMGALEPEAVSMQSIRAWLDAHPDRAPDVMNQNKSYVFFRTVDGLDPDAGPLGAQNVQLEAGRSLAVDRAYIPLGAPVWLDTTLPTALGEARFRHLMVAQDTGGAIKGAVRGDVFFGSGDLAAEAAGRMKAEGRYYILLPESVVPTG